MTHHYDPTPSRTEEWDPAPAPSKAPPEPVEERDDQDGVVWTRGVQSTVVDSSGSEVGHVLLLDADDADPLDVIGLSERLDCVSAVFESSPGSLHVWALRVEDWSEVALDMLDLRVEDPAHVASSHRRGYSVLRMSAKVRESGSVYKREPALLHVDPSSETDLPQSRPHAEALLSLAEEQGVRSGVEDLRDLLDGDSVRWVGDAETLLTDEYGTVTDDAKSDIRED